MEVIPLLVVGLLIFLIIGSIRAFVAGRQASNLQDEVRDLRRQIGTLRRRLEERKDRPEPKPVTPAAPREQKPLPPTTLGVPIADRDAPPPPPEDESVLEFLPPLPLEPAAETPAPPETEPEPVAPPPAAETETEPEAPPAETEPAKREPAPVAAKPKPRTDWGQWIEEVVGKRWMTYAGGLAIFVSVGFFVKYAIDVGWIGPGLRVGAGVALGLGILVLGDWLARRGTRTFGLGLIGAAGLPILYVSLFAAFQLYDLLPQWMTFVAMVLVTTAGMVLSIRHDSLVVSFLSLVGGLLTPSLVATGHDSVNALFAYLLLLDLGVLGIAVKRRWRSLDVLAFLGTVYYFAAWFVGFYLEDPDPPMAAALAWLGVFYATFLILPFAWHLSSKTVATLERFVMGLSVAAAVFWVGYLVLHPDHRAALGFVALVMAGCYAALGVLIRARLPEDRKAAFAFLAFAMTFLTISGPLHFGLNGITVAWCAEAVLLLWLGFAYRYLPVRLGGLVILGLAVGRLFVRHWPMHEEPFALLATGRFAIAALVCAAVAGFAVVHRVRRSRAEPTDGIVRCVVGLFAGLLALFVLHHEIGTWFALRPGAWPAWVFRTTGGAVYGVGALLFLAFGIRDRSLIPRLASVAVLAVGAALVFSTYLLGFASTVEPFANGRFVVAAGLALAGIGIGIVLSGRSPRFEPIERPVGDALCLAGGLALIAVNAVDLWHLLSETSLYAGFVGVAALFAVSAEIFLFTASRRRSAAFRVASFGLLLLATAGAVAAHDARPPESFLTFLNARFAVSVVVALSWIRQGEWTRRRPEILRPATRHDGAAVGFAGAILLLLALSADLEHWLSAYGRDEALAGLAVLWATGALSCLITGLRAREILWRAGSFLLLVAAGLMAGLVYGNAGEHEWPFFLSLPWLTALVTAVAAVAWGTLQRREPRVGEFARCVGTMLFLVVTNFELFHCLRYHHDLLVASCGITALNAAAATGLAVIGLRLPSLAWRTVALLPLFAAWILGVRLFDPTIAAEFIIFVNLRFIALIVAVIATFAIGRMVVNAAERTMNEEKSYGRGLLRLAVLLLFLVLSAESWHYARQEASGLQQARFATQMALSVTWSVYAVGLLLTGFRLRLRALRLTAIGLFAITVAKLVLIDLASIEQEQIFRILSFFVAGVLMIGGSYLYHRVEKRMQEEADPPEDDTASPSEPKP